MLRDTPPEKASSRINSTADTRYTESHMYQVSRRAFWRQRTVGRFDSPSASARRSSKKRNSFPSAPAQPCGSLPSLPQPSRSHPIPYQPIPRPTRRSRTCSCLSLSLPKKAAPLPPTHPRQAIQPQAQPSVKHSIAPPTTQHPTTYHYLLTSRGIGLSYGTSQYALKLPLRPLCPASLVSPPFSEAYSFVIRRSTSTRRPTLLHSSPRDLAPQYPHSTL
jgi:hypothetical protein